VHQYLNSCVILFIISRCHQCGYHINLECTLHQAITPLSIIILAVVLMNVLVFAICCSGLSLLSLLLFFTTTIYSTQLNHCSSLLIILSLYTTTRQNKIRTNTCLFHLYISTFTHQVGCRSSCVEHCHSYTSRRNQYLQVTISDTVSSCRLAAHILISSSGHNRINHQHNTVSSDLSLFHIIRTSILHISTIHLIIISSPHWQFTIKRFTGS